MRAAIAGDRDALKETCIHPHQDDFTFTDLLYYEDKIDPVGVAPEWPGSSYRLLPHPPTPGVVIGRFCGNVPRRDDAVAALSGRIPGWR